MSNTLLWRISALNVNDNMKTCVVNLKYTEKILCQNNFNLEIASKFLNYLQRNTLN